jgi:hypothetical protein
MGSLGEDTALPVVTVAALLVKEWCGHRSKSTRSILRCMKRNGVVHQRGQCWGHGRANSHRNEA